MDQHWIARPSRSHSDGTERCHAGKHACCWKTGQRCGCRSHSKHFGAGWPRPQFLQTLSSDYKANPCGTKLQKIQDVISDLNQNLLTLLESAHISNAVPSARIAAAENLILSTVNRFAALMPQKSPTTSRKVQAGPLPHTKDLKKQWNQQVCAPTGNSAMGRGICPVRIALGFGSR